LILSIKKCRLEFTLLDNECITLKLSEIITFLLFRFCEIQHRALKIAYNSAVKIETFLFSLTKNLIAYL